MLEKFKAMFDVETLYLSLLLILVAVTSFGLGQRSVLSTPDTGPEAASAVRIFRSDSPTSQRSGVEEPSSTQAVAIRSDSPVMESESSLTELLIASRNGTRYHLASCPGAKQITEANRITFTSRAAAEAAGYTPAANCPGLR